MNSFADAKKMLVGHQAAVIDRPRFYTFHGVISSSQGFTLGTSPWDESCKNKRKAACALLNRASLHHYHPMFDIESYHLVRDLFHDTRSGNQEINMKAYVQRFALNATLTLCYGLRMDHVQDDLLREIIEVGSAISLLRSTSENYQDYIPLLRFLPGNAKSKRAKLLRERRDGYLAILLERTRSNIAKGTDKPCVSSAMLKDEESQLSDAEVSSICLSLVSGGFETIPGTLLSCLGFLSTPSGQIFQDRAYAFLTRHHSRSLSEIWQSSHTTADDPYINALIKESLRYYTVSAMSLPRRTVSPLPWSDTVTIPAGTLILINAQAANHDPAHFGPDAASFNPERWLDHDYDHDTWTEKPAAAAVGGGGVQHFGFGAGSRACVGQLIAHRMLYTALVRVLACWRVVASETAPPETDYVEYNRVKSALVAVTREFEVRLERRVDDEGTMEEVLREAEGRVER